MGEVLTINWEGPLLPLSWVYAGGFWQTLGICLIICPIIPQVLGLVVDGYWMPWSWRYQFLAFVPGNPFLGLFVALSSTAVGEVRVNPVLNILVLIGCAVFWVLLTRLDKYGHKYSEGQRWSATKIYHNLLYLWYAYLVGVLFLTVLFSELPWDQKLLVSLPFLGWVACLLADTRFPKEIDEQRFKYAHTESKPIWKNGWRIRRRTANGYEYR